MDSWWRSRITSRLAVVRLVRRPADAFLMVRVFGFAAIVPALMRLPLARVERLLEPRERPHHTDRARVDHLVAIILGVLQAGRPLVRRGCVTRGLTLYYFLRQEGLDVRLCFGVGDVSGEGDVFGDGFDGHCWLVTDGMPFLEARDPRPLYTEMVAIPSRPRRVEVAGFQS